MRERERHSLITTLHNSARRRRLVKMFCHGCFSSEQGHLCLPSEGVDVDVGEGGGMFAWKMGALLSNDTHV